MNTPAHLVVNLTLLARGEGRPHWRTVLAGALLPDAAMFVFFFWATFLAEMPQPQIWDEAYFRPEWQDLFDLFNSVPIALAGMGFAAWRAHRPALLFFGSVLLHCALDLPLHHDDGHRHFYPLWDWRFESPLSYWDPRHYGGVVGSLETLAVFACCFLLWRRFEARGARVAVGSIAGLYALLSMLRFVVPFEPPA